MQQAQLAVSVNVATNSSLASASPSASSPSKPRSSGSPTRKGKSSKNKGSASVTTASPAPSGTAFYHRPIPHLPSAVVKPSVPAALYWSKTPVFGQMPGRNLRAHSATLVTDSDGNSGKIYVFGGCDAKTCWRDVWILDCETFVWMKPRPTGATPPPLRAHSATLVDRRIWIFGGGNGTLYSNAVHVFDTVSHIWTKPDCEGVVPIQRRAHTAVHWRDRILIFGGGDGVRALNDVQMLHLPKGNAESDKPRWEEMVTSGSPPKCRGYHSMNLIGDKLVIFGGSDGNACFGDVHVLDLETCVWKELNILDSYPRLSHTSTQIGSYLFVFGGHDGKDYSHDVLLFNLVNLEWETRDAGGKAPAERGYHTTILYDSRIFLLGGFDGKVVYDDIFTLDLGSYSYLPQITSFPFAS